MQGFITHLLDFIFPPTQEALRLRAFKMSDLETLPKPERSPFSFISSLFSYKDPLVTELVRGIKYKKDKNCIRLAGLALCKELEKRPDEKIILIPIPITRKRRRERGFNQCELLVDEICRLNPQKFEKRFDILFRKADDSEQKKKDRAGRLESRNMFYANKYEILFPIIIIDDVMTTGATLNNAREALLQSGYLDIGALTLSH